MAMLDVAPRRIDGSDAALEFEVGDSVAALDTHIRSLSSPRHLKHRAPDDEVLHARQGKLVVGVSTLLPTRVLPHDASGACKF